MLEEHIAVAHTTARNVSSLSHSPTKDFLKKKREKREKRHIATHTKILKMVGKITNVSDQCVHKSE